MRELTSYPFIATKKTCRFESYRVILKYLNVGTSSSSSDATPPRLQRYPDVFAVEERTYAPQCKAASGSGLREAANSTLWAHYGTSETLYQGDGALSTKPVMHYQGTAYLCY